jgi:hypothetical protein
MRTSVVFVLLVLCVMVVGYVEDPCATEGLMQGCIEK